MRIFFTRISKINHLTYKLGSCLWFGAASFSPLAFATVELSQLHVPQKYVRHLPRLFDGANLMQASQRCELFIQGSVSIDQSTVDHPIFRYTCRDHLSKTYHLLVDSENLHIIDDTRPAGSVSFSDLQIEIDEKKSREKALALQKRQEIERLEAELQALEYLKAEDRKHKEKRFNPEEESRRQYLWKVCQQRLTVRTRNMHSVKWITVNEPKPDWIYKTLLHYTIDFDSIDYHGKPLNYRAFCQLSADEDVSISIHPKALAKTPEAPIDEKAQK